MFGSFQRFSRTIAVCGAFLSLSVINLPTKALAGDRSGAGLDGGFGSGAVFVGRGGQVDRGVRFGFGEGRGVAVVGGGGRSSSFERYYDGRRYEAPGFRSSYRPDRRDRYEGAGVVVLDRADRGLRSRDLPYERFEARREHFEARRRGELDGSFVRYRDADRLDRLGRLGRDPRYDSRRDDRRSGYDRRQTVNAVVVNNWNGVRGTLGYDDTYSALAAREGSPSPLAAGPKILNVEAHRLDRRPIGPTGLDVVMTEGGSKIIRIAPGYRMARAQERRTPVQQSGGGLGLQPWSTGWLRYCQRSHASFDADLGTYVTSNGQIRFCTAE